MDNYLGKVMELLSPNDIIISSDDRNAAGTIKRAMTLYKREILAITCGINGTEEDWRYGPCLMMAGHSAAWTVVEHIFVVSFITYNT